MDYRMKNKSAIAVDEVSYLYIKRMSPTGRAERHGMTESPIEWPLNVYDAKSRFVRGSL